MIPTFHSRLGLWLLRIAVVVPLVLLSGFLMFELAGCNLGFNHPGSCQHIPDFAGELAFAGGYLGIMATVFASPPLIILALSLEFFARRSRADQ